MEQPVVVRGRGLTPVDGMPRLLASATTEAGGVVTGQWSLERAAFTDRHQHVEVNTVLEGELHVHCLGAVCVLSPGDTIAVPAGAVARYEAPAYARMTYVYGPGERGMTDDAYEEL